MEKLAAGDPQRIGAYRLLARLGAGGMGQVYLARSDRGRTVAVKLVRKELAAQDEFRNRFRLEVAAARRVGGAWTAPVLDANTEAAVPWVATGYVAGPALQDIVSGTGASGSQGSGSQGSGPQGGGVHGPLPARSVRILGSGLAHALQDIHSAGLIHRDLKPSNVLVTIEGPKVIDFGIARAMETVTGAGLTRTGGLVGSPGFMAPEQVRGTQITPACDVFCLGSVLAYAATGRLPFGTADTAVHVLMFRIAQEEPDLSELPEGLRELVDDCLKKDPKERPTPAQILARVGEPDDDEPWLPGTLLAQLGSHAVQLLDHEEPGARTELAFSKRPEPPSEASVPKPPPPGPSAKPAPGPASEPVPDPASIPPPPGGPGQGGGNGVHGMATMIGAGSPDAGPPPPAPQPPQPQAYGYPQNPQSPQSPQNQQSPQPQLPPPPQQYGYPQPGQPPLPPWGATPPYGPGPAGYGYPSPYGPTPPYGPAAPAPQPEPRRGARGTVALIAVALVVALGAGGSVYAFMDSGSEKTGASDSQTDKTADDKSSQAEDTPSEDPPPATDSPSPSASEDAGPGDVPKKYLGSWSGTISGGAGLSTRELSIRQGEVGETVLELTAEGPTDTGGTYLCVFEAALGEAPGASDGGPLRIGPSKVTEGRPMSSCTPGAATELTILPDGRLRRVTTSDGESVTYTKND